MTDFLAEKGYEVITATDGLDGLSKARHSSPDLIILDVILPKINGFTICRLLKYDQEYKDIPVIIWTWKDTDKDRTMGFELGADAYIPKPFSLNKLMESIIRMIG